MKIGHSIKSIKLTFRVPALRQFLLWRTLETSALEGREPIDILNSFDKTKLILDQLGLSGRLS